MPTSGPRDPEATRGRILTAAMEEFAAKGIAGARVDAIAARAETNKRMLYYYFGSKAGLFREILRRRLLAATSRLGGADATVAAPDRLGDRQHRLVTDREYVRLLMWEALQTPDTPGALAEEATRTELYGTWRESIRAAQARGELDAGLDPGQLVLSELALTMFPVAFPQVTRMITGYAIDSPEFLAARAEFLEHLVSHLTPDPATTGTSTGTSTDPP